MIWQIAEFYFDENTQLLTGPTGDQLLEPKVAAMLTFFCLNPERDINRDELLASVWPQQVVTDNTINRVILLLRKAFKDENKIKRFIITKPKVGYRFIADVKKLDTKPKPVKPPIKSYQSTYLLGLGLLLTLLLVLFTTEHQPETNSNPHVSPLIRLAGGQFNASMSPDGKRLVYTASDQQASTHQNTIYLLNPDNPIPIQISQSGGQSNYARWSHNGESLAYVFNDATGCQFHRVDVVGGIASTPEPFYQCMPNDYTQLAFSPDDRFLYFLERQHPIAPLQAYALDLTTGSKRRLSQPLAKGIGNHYLDVDDQSGAILLLSDQQPGISSLFRLETSDDTFQLLKTFDYSLNSAIWGHQTNTVVHPSIHPAYELIQTDLSNDQSSVLLSDSRRVSEPRKIHDGRNRDYSFTSYVHNRDITISGQADTSFNSSVMDYLPALSNQGGRLAFVSKRSGDSQVWLKKLDSNQLMAVEPIDAGRVYYSLNWSSDDNHIVANTNTGLLVIDANQIKITNAIVLKHPAYAVGWLSPQTLIYSHYQNDHWQTYSHGLNSQQKQPLESKWAMVLANEQQQLYFDQNMLIHRDGEPWSETQACGFMLFRYALTLELDGAALYCRSRENEQVLLKITDDLVETMDVQVSLGEFYSVAHGRLAKTVMASGHSDIMRTHFRD